MIKRSILSALLVLTSLHVSAQDAELYTSAPNLVRAARSWVGIPLQYNGSYRVLAYPGGDPGQEVGVCTDLVVRSYRALGVDLQVLVHEDMKRNMSAYPAKRLYQQTRPDTNIDHRRVPNLMTFFGRRGQSFTLSLKPGQLDKWRPGDIVVFDLMGNGIPSHIGIVSDQKTGPGRPLVIHHFPPHPSEDDCLRRWKIMGHFRYFPDPSPNMETENR